MLGVVDARRWWGHLGVGWSRRVLLNGQDGKSISIKEAGIYSGLLHNRRGRGLRGRILGLIRVWRRQWQPTPVFLPGESQGRGSLVGCRLWGRTVGHDWIDSAAAAAESGVWAHMRLHGSCMPLKSKGEGTFISMTGSRLSLVSFVYLPVRVLPRHCWGNAGQGIWLDPCSVATWYLYGAGAHTHSLSRPLGEIVEVLSQPVAGSWCHVLCGLKWEIGEDVTLLFSNLNPNNLSAQKVLKIFLHL